LQQTTQETSRDDRLIIQRATGVGNWAMAESMLAGGHDPQRVKDRLNWYRETYPASRFRVISQSVTITTVATPLEW
jgi:hypothetical protein